MANTTEKTKKDKKTNRFEDELIRVIIEGFTVFNDTPHEVKIFDKDGNVLITIPASGTVARASQTEEVVGELGGIKLVKMTFGKTEGLLEPQKGVFHIVSLLTAQAAEAEGRPTWDLLLTSGPVRDEKGRIIGCLCLAAYSNELIVMLRGN